MTRECCLIRLSANKPIELRRLDYKAIREREGKAAADLWLTAVDAEIERIRHAKR